MPKSSEAQAKLTDANKLFIAALMKMYPEKDFYSDANFTMRMTYGSVKGIQWMMGGFLIIKLI